MFRLFAGELFKMYCDPAVLIKALENIERFIKNTQTKANATLAGIEQLLSAIYCQLTNKFKKTDPSRLSQIVFSEKQATVLVCLAKSCVEYLYFHNSSERSMFYKMFASHGSSGQKRAVAILEKLINFTISFQFIDESDTNKRINQLREEVIYSSMSKYTGRNSLSTYLKETSQILVTCSTTSPHP